MGSGSTLWMVDPARELVFVYFAAGLVEGLSHFQNLQKLCDLALGSRIEARSHHTSQLFARVTAALSNAARRRTPPSSEQNRGAPRASRHDE
ncbi:hypothetical protein ACFZDK_27590 [Streptomyces sp. NPDC007901]|uniref:hypothetical protein n=1 Tax=Streptomyces sp. NPDC007901 TaxID=3364785 RepID=UPI0036E0039A